MTRTAVLYHANCPDGFTAAWVAFNALGDDVAAMHPVSHGDTPPDLTGIDTAYIVDFSYPHETLVELTEGGARRVVVLDHHQTAIDDVVANLGQYATGRTALFSTDDEDPYEAVLDNGRSGAGITWDYFHPGEPRPPVVDYVEDRDLWRFKHPQSEAVSAYIRSQPYTIETWDRLAKTRVPAMANAGTGVQLHIDAYCRAAANHAYWCEMGDRTFPIVNVTYESCSEVAAHLLNHFETDMAGYYFETGAGRWQYGFRSRNGVTVHDHALAFGGGGHPQASGCTVDQPVHTRVPRGDAQTPAA